MSERLLPLVGGTESPGGLSHRRDGERRYTERRAYYSTAEIERLTGCSRGAVRGWLARHCPPPTARDGNSRASLWPRSEIDPLLPDLRARAGTRVYSRGGCVVTECVFCDIVAGDAPADIVEENRDTVIFRPLGPVVAGHVLVVPTVHVVDAATDVTVTAMTMFDAAHYAAGLDSDFNIITSAGKAATQSVFHLHVHVIPRVAGDELMVPWGTTGDPQAPHWCAVAERLQRQLAEATP